MEISNKKAENFKQKGKFQIKWREIETKGGKFQIKWRETVRILPVPAGATKQSHTDEHEHSHHALNWKKTLFLTVQIKGMFNCNLGKQFTFMTNVV